MVMAYSPLKRLLESCDGLGPGVSSFEKLTGSCGIQPLFQSHTESSFLALKAARKIKQEIYDIIRHHKFQKHPSQTTEAWKRLKGNSKLQLVYVATSRSLDPQVHQGFAALGGPMEMEELQVGPVGRLLFP